MSNGDLGWITNFIWGIADDVLRDLYVRGKYRDVILPMTVLRRLDAVLEPTKQAVLDMKDALDKAGITNQDAALRQAAGQAFYNTSKFTLRDLRARAQPAAAQGRLRGLPRRLLAERAGDPRQLRVPQPDPAPVEGRRARHADREVPRPVDQPQPEAGPERRRLGQASRPRQPRDGHDLRGAGPPLQRREQRGGRRALDAARRRQADGAADLPADRRPDRVRHLPALRRRLRHRRHADGRRGDLQQLAQEHGKQVATHLYGQEINAETYAICKADLLLKGEGEAADNIVGGPEYSTLSNDAFPSREFDFMLSNPPYGKSWKSDLERMGGKDGIKDPRFIIEHAGDPEYSLITRSSDGQMLFLANMLSKMKHGTQLGSRIAEVHNGSSLFTGDAGQGESNIRRWIIENDWLEAIVALPLNMFYNTGIATYIWVLTNRKPEHRQGKVQLIDATQWFKPLRKNLGKKNCELSDDGHPADLRHVPGIRGDRAVEDLRRTPRSATGR